MPSPPRIKSEICVRLYSSSADRLLRCLSQKNIPATALDASTTPTTTPAAIAVVFDPPPLDLGGDELLELELGAWVTTMVVWPGVILVTTEGVGDTVGDGAVPVVCELLDPPPYVPTLSVSPVR